MTRAYLDLRLIPNKDLLQELIDQANGLNKASYSAETWKAVSDALNKAAAVLNDPEATQKEVDNAKDVLAKAMIELTEVSSEPVENSTVVKPGDTTSIKTGDEVNIIYPFAGLVIASIVLYENKKRKFN